MCHFGRFEPNCLGTGWNSDANTVKRNELVLDMVNEDPNLSIPAISRGLLPQRKLNRPTTPRKLTSISLHSRLSFIRPEDYERIINFSRWFLHRHEEGEHFIEDILFIDELNFSLRMDVKHFYTFCL